MEDMLGWREAKGKKLFLFHLSGLIYSLNSSHFCFILYKLRYMITEISILKTFPKHSFANQFGLYGSVKQYEIRTLGYCSNSESLYRKKLKIDVVNHKSESTKYICMCIFFWRGCVALVRFSKEFVPPKIKNSLHFLLFSSETEKKIQISLNSVLKNSFPRVLTFKSFNTVLPVALLMTEYTIKHEPVQAYIPCVHVYHTLYPHSLWSLWLK